jgi:hypothetical protein
MGCLSIIGALGIEWKNMKTQKVDETTSWYLWWEALWIYDMHYLGFIMDP